jgi:hypothetical protein
MEVWTVEKQGLDADRARFQGLLTPLYYNRFILR